MKTEKDHLANAPTALDAIMRQEMTVVRAYETDSGDRNVGDELPAAQMVTDRLLTIADVCRLLRVSRTTVWRLMHEHGLRAIRVGGLRRIRQHDLEAWLERHCTSSSRRGK